MELAPGSGNSSVGSLINALCNIVNYDSKVVVAKKITKIYDLI